MMYLNLFENAVKVKPTQSSATLQRISKVFTYCWKEGAASQNKNFPISRHDNAKKPTTAAYYRTDIQTISKVRTMLSENCSSSSIYNKKRYAL